MIPDRVDPAEVDERPQERELPAALALRLAWAKTAEVQARHAGAFVLGADTVVSLGRRILPKPEAEAEARRSLERLSGRRHRVTTAIAVAAPDGLRRDRLVPSTVAFKRLDEAELDWYIRSGEWRGKAGGYAIQGKAALFVRWLRGSHSAVVGLPLYETAALLQGLGYPVGKDMRREL